MTITTTPQPRVASLVINAVGGCPVAPDDADTPSAYYRALESGFGVIVPVRDRDGQLVVSSRPADTSAPLLSDLLANRPVWPGRQPMIGLHVQAVGLASLIHRTLASVMGLTPFVYGMTTADIPDYLDGAIPLVVCQSEYERSPAFYECAEGVWMESIEREWFDQRHIVQHLKAGKHVLISSPELHGRPYLGVWTMLAPIQSRLGEHSPRLQLCTKLPLEARDFFAS